MTSLLLVETHDICYNVGVTEKPKDKVQEAFRTIGSSTEKDLEMSGLLNALQNRYNFLLEHGGVPQQEEKKELDPADAALNDLVKNINKLNDKSDPNERMQLKRQVWEFKRTYPDAIAKGADRERMKNYAMQATYCSPDWKFFIGIIQSGGGAPYIIDGVDGDEGF